MSVTDKAEYRITAKDAAGRPVLRYISASSSGDARAKAREWITRINGKIVVIDKKRSFSYKAVRGTKVITGTQVAYSRTDVVDALKKIGFEVKSVRGGTQAVFAAPPQEIVSFVTQCAKLLEQKIPFHEVLHLLGSSIKNKVLNQAIRDILNDLREGMDSRQAFARQGKVFGHHTAMLLGIATKSGDIVSIFKSVAVLVERQAEFSKGLKSSLILPGITALTLVASIVYYAMFLVPDMMDKLGPYMMEIPPLTAATLDVTAYVQDNYLWIIIVTILSIVGFYVYISTPGGKIVFDRFVIHVPYIGRILKNTSTEIFCRVLGIMYTSSGENIDAIQIAAEASGNRHFSRTVKMIAIPMMLRHGIELDKALTATRFFPDMVLARFKTAAETGTVKMTAQQLADYYQLENSFAMKNLVNMIELAVTAMIMIALVFLTVLSSETAAIDLNFGPM